MNKKLQLIRTDNMSRADWLAYRKTGVGASDVGAILGLSPYKSSIELFYEKLADGFGYDVENIFMFMGLQHEDKIAELWQYWEGSEESVIENFRIGKIIQKCQRVNAYVRNPDYPWLFVSLDRKINKDQKRKGEGTLELKTISSWEADKWETGIPMPHVVQVQTQILACEFLFGDLATMKDGRRFDVIPFDFHPAICQRIVVETKKFWDRVEKARAFLNMQVEAERNFNLRLAEDCQAEIAKLEPEPDGSDAYNEFLKKKFHIATPGELKGTEEELKHARALANVKVHIKNKQEEAQLHENTLKRFLGSNSIIDFGTAGKVTWKADVNGVRRFLNSVKI